ncbi:MAG: hypothetical protein MUP98_10440, partial [Candidatus Aminicenantes bacterium]|nr:hypothetical protein [Candidatus Aminicenantes bacterium]
TDLITASKILGHSDVKMTMRYCHPSDSDKRAAIEKASQSLFQGRQKDVNEISTLTQGDVVETPQFLYN